MVKLVGQFPGIFFGHFSGALPQTKPLTKRFKSIGLGSPHLSLWQWHCDIGSSMLHWNSLTRLDRCSVREERVRPWKNTVQTFWPFARNLVILPLLRSPTTKQTRSFRDPQTLHLHICVMWLSSTGFAAVACNMMLRWNGSGMIDAAV